jgi:hypothetical protein
LVACGTPARTEAPAPVPPAASGSAAHEPTPEMEPAPALEPPPADPAPAVTISAEVDPYARVTLSVANRGAETARVSPSVTLEREEAGAFAGASELGAFSIGGELAEDGCVTLAPGAELRATWSCLRGEASGLARDCARAPDGRYRFVAVACRGGGRTEGEVFEYRR